MALSLTIYSTASPALQNEAVEKDNGSRQDECLTLCCEQSLRLVSNENGFCRPLKDPQGKPIQDCTRQRTTHNGPNSHADDGISIAPDPSGSRVAS